MNIEGRNAVLEAIKSGKTIDSIMVEKGQNHQIVALARQSGIKLQFVEKEILDKLSATKKHQGFIAKVNDFVYCEVEDILALAEERGEDVFLVLLDGVEDPHNLGSIIRVCECAGVHGIVIPKHRSASVNETVVRASAGATEHMLVSRVVNINNTIEQLKKKNVWVFCADMDGESVYKSNLKGNLALVIGGEGNGVKKLTKELCDVTVSLPILGQVNSLNASVACGIVVYEAVRQRKGL